jgi:hypothetical protein
MSQLKGQQLLALAAQILGRRFNPCPGFQLGGSLASTAAFRGMSAKREAQNRLVRGRIWPVRHLTHF